MNLYWGKLQLDLTLSAGPNDSHQYGESGDRCQLACTLPGCNRAASSKEIFINIPFFVHFIHGLKTCLSKLLSYLSFLAIYWNSLLYNATKRTESTVTSQVWLQHARTDLTYLYSSDYRWAIAIKISMQNTQTPGLARYSDSEALALQQSCYCNPN